MSWFVANTILLSVSTSWWILILQIVLGGMVVWVVLHKRYFRQEEEEERPVRENDLRGRLGLCLEDWDPNELVPCSRVMDRILNPKLLESKAKKYVLLGQEKCLNAATINFLNFVGDTEIEAEALGAVEQYGVGACGPRGFYGTTEAHLQLEEMLARFMGTEDAIIYAFGLSCIASAIPAYAKRHDLILADERVNFAIQKGIQASKSKVRYFEHNNHMSLEKLIRDHYPRYGEDVRARVFVIVEGIYLNTGSIVDLPSIMRLKRTYKFRLFIDESISFAALRNGRGVTKFFNVPAREVDMIMGTLEYAVGSLGGFCCGSRFIIEHQRLSGLGYCFSASQPPLHAIAALKAVEMMWNNPDMFVQLNNVCRAVYATLKKLNGVTQLGWEDSPVQHLRLRKSHTGDYSHDTILQLISDYCYNHGLAITAPSYIELRDKYDPVPTLRVTVNRTFSEKEVEFIGATLQNALDHIKFCYMQEGIPGPVTVCIKKREDRAVQKIASSEPKHVLELIPEGEEKQAAVLFENLEPEIEAIQESLSAEVRSLQSVKESIKAIHDEHMKIIKSPEAQIGERFYHSMRDLIKARDENREKINEAFRRLQDHRNPGAAEAACQTRGAKPDVDVDLLELGEDFEWEAARLAAIVAAESSKQPVGSSIPQTSVPVPAPSGTPAKKPVKWIRGGIEYDKPQPAERRAPSKVSDSPTKETRAEQRAPSTASDSPKKETVAERRAPSTILDSPKKETQAEWRAPSTVSDGQKKETPTERRSPSMISDSQKKETLTEQRAPSKVLSSPKDESQAERRAPGTISDSPNKEIQAKSPQLRKPCESTEMEEDSSIDYLAEDEGSESDESSPYWLTETTPDIDNDGPSCDQSSY